MSAAIVRTENKNAKFQPDPWRAGQDGVTVYRVVRVEISPDGRDGEKILKDWEGKEKGKKWKLTLFVTDLV